MPEKTKRSNIIQIRLMPVTEDNTKGGFFQEGKYEYVSVKYFLKK